MLCKFLSSADFYALAYSNPLVRMSSPVHRSCTHWYLPSHITMKCFVSYKSPRRGHLCHIDTFLVVFSTNFRKKILRLDPRSRQGKFRCPNMLSLVSLAGMTLDKCIVLRIGTLTGCPLCRESYPLCRLKNPRVISIWLPVGFHPATRNVQSTPADNTRKRIWQYIEKERKEYQ